MFQSKTYVCAYTYCAWRLQLYCIRIYNLFCSLLPRNCKMLLAQFQYLHSTAATN